MPGVKGVRRPDTAIRNKVANKESVNTEQALELALKKIDDLQRQIDLSVVALQQANLPVPESLTPSDYIKTLQAQFTKTAVSRVVGNSINVMASTNNAIALEKIYSNGIKDAYGNLENQTRDEGEPKTANIIIFGEYTGCDES